MSKNFIINGKNYFELVRLQSPTSNPCKQNCNNKKLLKSCSTAKPWFNVGNKRLCKQTDRQRNYQKLLSWKRKEWHQCYKTLKKRVTHTKNPIWSQGGLKNLLEFWSEVFDYKKHKLLSTIWNHKNKRAKSQSQLI